MGPWLTTQIRRARRHFLQLPNQHRLSIVPVLLARAPENALKTKSRGQQSLERAAQESE